jgi:hypothetical protein
MKQCWIGMVCNLNHIASPLRETRVGKKDARITTPSSLGFDLTVLFSLDPLSSVLSFSF